MRGERSFEWPGHTVVVGAGPAGLSAAYALSRQGLPVTVIEKDDVVGGLGRTIEFMGCRFDVGPRPVFSRRHEVDAMVTSMLGRELRSVARVSRALLGGRFIDRRVRMSEQLVKLGPVEGTRCLASWARARMRPIERPISFADRLADTLGRRAYEILVETHLRKVWGVSGGEFESSVEFEDVEAAACFRYPRRGSGQIWETMAGSIRDAGGRVQLGEEVVALRHGKSGVLSVAVRDRNGLMMDVMASQFVSTMPLQDLVARLWPEPPAAVRRAADVLKYRDLITVSVVVDRERVCPDQWIDVLDPAVRVARISNFRNFSRAMVPDSGLSGLGMEYFCEGGDEVWRMTDRELLDLARRELVALGLCARHEVKAGMVSRWAKACAVPDMASRRAAQAIREWVGRALPDLWLVEDCDAIDGLLGHQADPMRSGPAVAAEIGQSGGLGADKRQPQGWGAAEGLAVAGGAGYTEPAVPE